MRVHLLKILFALSFFAFPCSTLFPMLAHAQDSKSLRDSRGVRKSILRRLGRALKRGKRALKKNPCRAKDAFDSILNAQNELPNQTSSWRRRNKRSFLRSVGKLARQAKRYKGRLRNSCEVQKRLEEHQSEVSKLQRARDAKNNCEAYQQIDEAEKKLKQGPGISIRPLPRAWKKSYSRWYKRQKRNISRKKGKVLRACRRQWRKLYASGKFPRSCKRRWRPRSRRQRGELWIGVDQPAMIFVNNEACGTASIRTTLKAGRYLIRIASPTGSFSEQNLTVLVKRGSPTVLLFRPEGKSEPMGMRTAPNKRQDLDPPPRRRDTTVAITPEDPPPRRVAQNDPTIRTRRAPPPDMPEDPPPARKTFTPSDKVEAPLWIGIGARFFSRTLYYNDDIFGELSPYNLLMAPALALQMHWYPGAHFTNGPLAHIGLVAEFSYALGLESRTPDGKTLPTSAYQLQAGLRGRFPIGPISLMLTAGYALQSFQIDTKNPANESGLEIPSVEYHALRIEARAYWAIHPRIGLFLGSAYRVILGAGEIATDAYFPKIWIGQVDAEAGLDINILRWFAIRTRFQFNHYFSSMNSQPGDRRVAGGAVDQYANIDLFLVFRL
ncbi:MAG: hypothetical protein H6727_20225 [Myxococcales bacterium]|nr:hypothetical protein [Myxococcales bacterium]